VWIEAYRDKEKMCPQQLYDLLRTAVFNRWKKILAEEICPFYQEDFEVIHKLHNYKR
jgi:hypothetical protein